MVGCAKGGLGFTVQHNIRVVCVGTASGSTLCTCLPLRRHPPPPQDARAELLIGRHYSKWRLRHIRSVLLAYRGKENVARSPDDARKIFHRPLAFRLSTVFPPFFHRQRRERCPPLRLSTAEGRRY